MIDPNGVYAWALRWRGIEPGEECPECGGSGWIVYGSTATYMGGIGGAAMTPGACNVCLRRPAREGRAIPARPRSAVHR